MRILAILIGPLLWGLGAAFAAEPKPVVMPEKFAALLTAQGPDGRPVIPPEHRTYFDGLNDHLKELLFRTVEKEIITRADHLGRILALELRPQKMEVLLQDNCLLCHTDLESQTGKTLFSLSPATHQSPAHMNLKDFVEDAHFRRGLSCAGCHGGDPASEEFGHEFVKEWPEKGRDKDRSWLLQFCARCHSDPTFMNRFNPALPTDQLAKYQESPHGKLLLHAKDVRAPSCVSCHGVHGIRGAKHPLSWVHPKRVPDTCGACHANPQIMAGINLPDGTPIPTNQVAEYKASVHGRALLERGDLGAPACNDCHGNHAAMPVGLSSVSQSCSLCHAGNASLFDGSKHKRAFEKNQWAQCAKCHHNHAIAKTHFAMLGPGPDSMCAPCHQQYAKDNPECDATAAFFHQTLTHMDQVWKRSQLTAEELAMKGLDIDPLTAELNELADTLKRARSYVHSFSRSTFQQVADAGDKSVQHIAELTAKAQAEYRTRQLGLIASLALMGAMMLALYLKLRRLERKPSEAGEPAS